MALNPPFTTTTSEGTLTDLRDVLERKGTPGEILNAGLAYLGAVDDAQALPAPPDPRSAPVAEITAFLARLRYPHDRLSWGLALAGRAYEAGENAQGDAVVHTTLADGYGSLDGASAIALLAWLERHLHHLSADQLPLLLDRTGFTPLTGAQTRDVADRLVSAWAAAGRRAPGRALAQLLAVAAWTPDDKMPFWARWRTRVVAESTNAVARALGEAAALEAHVGAIKAIGTELGAPGCSLLALPISEPLREYGIIPRLEDLEAHPDELLASRGAADWLGSLGSEAPDCVLPLLKRSAFKRFDSAYSPHRATQARIDRAALAYRALVPHFPFEAVRCLDAMLAVADPLGRLRGRKLTRSSRWPGLRVDAPTRQAVIIVNRWSGPIDITTSGKLAAARAIAPERPAMAAALIAKSLVGYGRPLSDEFSPGGEAASGLWMNLAFTNPVSDKVRNLLHAAVTVDMLPAEQRNPLELELCRLFTQEETWLLSFDAKGVKDLVYADGISRLAPEVARRVLDQRVEKDQDVALVVARVRDTLGDITAAALAALFCATSELWDHENRLWSREMMIATVATKLLPHDPAGACRLAQPLERDIDNRALDAFEVCLVLAADERERTKHLFQFHDPLLDHATDNGALGTLARTEVGWVLARALARREAPEELLAAIARERDPYRRAFLHAFVARRPDETGEAALAAFERALPGLTDDWMLAELVNDVALIAGPRPADRDARIFHGLIAALDENYMYDPDDVGPLVFQAIHRRPPDIAESLLTAVVEREPLGHSFAAFAAALMQHPTTLPPERQAALLAKAAARLLPELKLGVFPDLSGFVAALARFDTAMALAVCQGNVMSDYQGDAFVALLPHDPAAAIAYARGEADNAFATLSVGRVPALEALATEGATAEAFQAALSEDPKGVKAFLALARRAFPGWPTWLVEAHAAHDLWEPLLTHDAPWPKAVCERFEATLLAGLERPKGQPWFWPTRHEVGIRWSRYFDREPQRAAETAIAWFGELDYAPRYAALGLIAGEQLNAQEKTAMLVQLASHAVARADLNLLDRILAELAVLEETK